MNSAHLSIDVHCSNGAKKKIDLAPPLGANFGVWGAKIEQYSTITVSALTYSISVRDAKKVIFYNLKTYFIYFRASS